MLEEKKKKAQETKNEINIKRNKIHYRIIKSVFMKLSKRNFYFDQINMKDNNALENDYQNN